LPLLGIEPRSPGRQTLYCLSYPGSSFLVDTVMNLEVHKRRAISLPGDQLSASQEEICYRDVGQLEVLGEPRKVEMHLIGILVSISTKIRIVGPNIIWRQTRGYSIRMTFLIKRGNGVKNPQCTPMSFTSVMKQLDTFITSRYVVTRTMVTPLKYLRNLTSPNMPIFFFQVYR
jgi:hypothetical protein